MASKSKRTKNAPVTDLPGRPPLGERVLASARKAVAHAKALAEGMDEGKTDEMFGVRIHYPRTPEAEAVDVKAIRARTGLSQSQFARRYGIPLGTLQNWERDRREPEGPARTLLIVIDKEPKAVDRALSLFAAR